MVEQNGRLKMHPVFAWAIGTYLLALGTGVGALLTQVTALRSNVDAMIQTSADKWRTRAEGDEIIRRVDSEVDDLRHRIMRLEASEKR